MLYRLHQLACLYQQSLCLLLRRRHRLNRKIEGLGRRHYPAMEMLMVYYQSRQQLSRQYRLNLLIHRLIHLNHRQRSYHQSHLDRHRQK